MPPKSPAVPEEVEIELGLDEASDTDALRQRLGKKLGVRAMALPLPPGKDEIFLHYPAIADTEPGSTWLRTSIKALV